MAIASVNVIDTQRTVDPASSAGHLDGFTTIGGQTPSATTPAVTQTQVIMSGASDYIVGGYALSAAQLGFASTVLSATVSGPTGAPTPLPGCAPWSNPGAAVSAAYNASTNKLQFYADKANLTELGVSSAVGGAWLVVSRGF